ncbi:hypothetical protein AAK979_06865 [Ileibacterium valens]
MALSKETVYVYLTCEYDTKTSQTVYSALLFSESRRKPLFARLESILKSSWKGSRLKELSVLQIDARNEKIARDLLRALFSSNQADGLFLDYTEGNSTKNNFEWMSFIKQLSQSLQNKNGVIVYDPQNIRPSTINTGLKKGALHAETLKEDCSDSIGLQISSFLGQIQVEQRNELNQAMMEMFSRELKIDKHFHSINGDMLWITSQLDQDQSKLVMQAISMNPALVHSGLIEKMIRKKSSYKEYQNLLEIIQEGIDPEALAQSSGNNIESKASNVRKKSMQLDGPLQKLTQKSDEKKAKEQFENLVRSLDFKEQGDMQENQREWLKNRFEEEWTKILTKIDKADNPALAIEQISRSLKSIKKKHAFIGCYCDPKNRKEQIMALIPYHYSKEMVPAFQDWLPSVFESFGTSLENAASNDDFKQWIDDYFIRVYPDDGLCYSDQMKSLIIKIAEYSKSTFIHMSLLTGQDLKAVLVENNWYLPYLLENEEEQPVLRLARLAAAMHVRGQTHSSDQTEIKTAEKTDMNEDTEIKESGYGNDGSDNASIAGQDGISEGSRECDLPLFFNDDRVAAHLNDSHKKILSSPWLNTALTKRMAAAFENGLKPFHASCVLFGETGKSRQWKLRELIIDYLYPARIQSFLKTQLYVRTLDEYDFLSYPGFSLEKMKTLSQIFEMGHSVEEVRKRVCQKSTLKSIESLLHDLEQSKAGRYIHTSCSAKNEKQSKAKSKSSTLGCNSADDEKDKETEIRIFIPNHLEMYIALKIAEQLQKRRILESFERKDENLVQMVIDLASALSIGLVETPN